MIIKYNFFEQAERLKQGKPLITATNPKQDLIKLKKQEEKLIEYIRHIEEPHKHKQELENLYKELEIIRSDIQGVERQI